VSAFYGWLTLRSGSVWPAAITHSISNATDTLMIWFVRGPTDPRLDLLIGPMTVGIVGSLGWVALGLLIFFIPGALAPTAGLQPGDSASASSILEGSSA
jgi:membrane protease YdiL (CAAX protease family)